MDKVISDSIPTGSRSFKQQHEEEDESDECKRPRHHHHHRRSSKRRSEMNADKLSQYQLSPASPTLSPSTTASSRGSKGSTSVKKRKSGSNSSKAAGPRLALDAPPLACAPNLRSSGGGRRTYRQNRDAEGTDDDFTQASEDIMPGAVRVGTMPDEESCSTAISNVNNATSIETTQDATMLQAEVAEDFRDAVAAALQQGRQEGRQEALGAAAELNSRVANLEQHQQGDENAIVAVATSHMDSTEKVDDDERKSKRRGWIYCSILLLIILVAGGIVGGLLLSDNDNSDPQPTSIAEDATGAVTTVPTTSSTASPTADKPTEESLYDPPTPEDCQAIANRSDLNGQDDIVVQSFDIDMDVSLLDPGGPSENMTEPLLRELEEKLHAYLIPALAGCNQTTETDNNMLRRKQRRILASTQYAIANAKVLAEFSNGVPCKADAPQQCFRVVVNLILYLKGNVDLLTLYGLISDKVGDALLVPLLQLEEPPFHHVEIVFVRSNDPTNVPSRSPTEMPTMSIVPSLEPTMDPTKAPVLAPVTAEPTSRPTENPSNFPTNCPSPQPTELHTATPTPGPTKAPTKLPTSNPTSKPSTSSPTTQAPTKDPSPQPVTSPPIGLIAETKDPSPQPVTPPPFGFITETKDPSPQPVASFPIGLTT